MLCQSRRFSAPWVFAWTYQALPKMVLLTALLSAATILASILPRTENSLHDSARSHTLPQISDQARSNPLSLNVLRPLWFPDCLASGVACLLPRSLVSWMQVSALCRTKPLHGAYWAYPCLWLRLVFISYFESLFLGYSCGKKRDFLVRSHWMGLYPCI